MGIPNHDLHPFPISDPSPDCAVQEQGKEGPSGACEQPQYMSHSSGAMDKNEEMDIDVVQHTAQASALSNLSPGSTGQEQGDEETLGLSEEPQHVPSGSTEVDEEIVITGTNLFLRAAFECC